MSVSPGCGTGYGMQTAVATKQLRRMGHDVAIFAIYGINDAVWHWGDIPIYPNEPESYGTRVVKDWYKDWNADVVISLYDTWVLSEMPQGLNWFPICPVDHEPIPPRVLKVMKENGSVIKPIAMSQFGQRMLKDGDVDSYYIPHSVDCKLFAPDIAKRNESRAKVNWTDKFVVGTVATNSPRKNWNGMMVAMVEFMKAHDDVVWYMHTHPLDKGGMDLNKARYGFGIDKKTFFPSMLEMRKGIPQEVVVNAYNTMDVFLLASKGEGFGIPSLEAQSCGVPVIVSKNTAQTELMGGGWLLEKQTKEWDLQDAYEYRADNDEMLEKLEMAYEAKKDGSIVEMQKKARAKALEYDEMIVYDKFWPPMLADMQKQIDKKNAERTIQSWQVNLIPATCSPGKILDVGNDEKQPYRKYLEGLGDYTGVDKDTDATNLKFKDKEFGFVWCSDLLEHANGHDPQAIIGEMQRVGVHGVCIFDTPDKPDFALAANRKKIDIPHVTTKTGEGIITW